MAVDKALNRAPLGLSSVMEEEDPLVEIEIEIEGEESDAEEAEEDAEDDFGRNLAEDIDEKDLVSLASDLLADYDDDVSARKDWLQTYVDGLELLGLKAEDRTEPWPGACGVYHPLLTEALVKFQAETMMETFPASGPVKTQILGEETPEKKEAAVRVRDDMNNQLCNVMTEYRPEHERMLWGLGLSGNAFKKVYYDPAMGRQVSMYVPAEDVVVPYGASNIQTAERVTHVMRKTENEIKKLQAAGFYRDIDLGEPENTLDDVEKKIAEKMGFRATTDDRYKLLEMQVELDLKGYEDTDDEGDETGIALPYIVTIEKGTQDVLSIRRNWKVEDEKEIKRSHFVHYGYIPGFGFYHLGLIHLIGAFAKSGTSILRQLVDAGTLSNLPGGFKTKGLRVKGDDTPIAPAEFRDVDVASGTIKDNIMTLPYKEPSQVLYTLLGTIVEEGRRFASAADLKVSDMSAQSPVGTTLAILERTLKVMSAVQARIHHAMKQEFNLLRDIIRDYTPEEYSYEPEDGTPRAKKEDYALVAVIPVSDPNAATMAQKVVQYQAVMQLAAGAPQLYDLPYLHRQMLEVLGINNAAKLVPTEDDQKPKDPVTENMAILNSKPVKAFAYQDHQAHITVHTSMMQDPMTAELMGQNPKAQAIGAAMAAHISDHMGFEYRKRIEDAAGVPYPAPDEDMDEGTELNISRLAAAAAQQVLQASKAQAAQKQAAAAQQDPVVQMQQKQLEIKAHEVEIKRQKLLVDGATAKDKLDFEKEKLASQEKIAGMKVGADIAASKSELSLKEKEASIRTGVDISREISKENQANAQRRQQVDEAERTRQHALELATAQSQEPTEEPTE